MDQSINLLSNSSNNNFYTYKISIFNFYENILNKKTVKVRI